MVRRFVFAVILALPAVLPIQCDPGWLDVPFVRQATAGCGSASIAMVMQYWLRHDSRLDPESAEEERIRPLLPASQKGVAGESLRRYLTAHGFDAYVFRGTMEDLSHHTEKGRPLVVCLAPAGARGPLHYAVVAGLAPDAVLLNDPTRGKLIREDLTRFRTMWELTGNWALLAVPSAARR